MLIGKPATHGRGGLDEGIGALPRIRILRWKRNQQGSGFETTNAVRRTRVSGLVDLTQLTQDFDPDLRLLGDLVPKAQALELGRKLDWTIVTEEAGKQIANKLRCCN